MRMRFATVAALLLGAAFTPAQADTQQDYIPAVSAAIQAMKAGDTEGAKPHLDKAIKSGKFFGEDQATLLNYRGVVYYKRKDWDNAIADFTEAIRHNPNVANFYSNRAEMRKQKGDMKGYEADMAEAKQRGG